MRYNKKYQRLADEYAQQTKKYAYALYIGQYESEMSIGNSTANYLVFRKMYGDTKQREHCAPAYFLINEEKIVEVKDWMEVVDKVKKCDVVKRGKQIYKEIEDRIQVIQFSSRNYDEWRYLFNLHASITNMGFEPPNRPYHLYLMLQAAERLGKKVKSVAYEWCKNQNDGWVYYYKLTK